MSGTYKRSVFTGPGQIRIDEVPIPEPGPKEALIKVKSCAICTWEQRMYTGEEKFYPLSGGHEVSGELVSVGKFVHTDAKIGDPVIAATLTRCGYCESCRKGLDSNCDNSFKPQWNTDVPGPSGLSEYVLVQDYMIYKGSRNVSFDEMALTEPLSCVVRSVNKAQVRFSENVVIVGAGIMGLLHLKVNKMRGARVIVSEPNPERAAFALKMGADAVIDPTKKPFADAVKELTDGRGADAIFCAVSIAGAVESAMDAAAKGGRVMVYASIHPRGTKISVDPNLFHGKEVTLTGTVSQSRQDVLEASRLISLGLVDMKPFVSKVYPFGQLEDAIKAALRPDTYRVLVNM